jgi:fatty acid desaturase
MSDHGRHPHEHHHHHPGHVHPPATVQPSILRLSARQRLSVAAGLIALVWLATFWAMQ